MEQSPNSRSERKRLQRLISVLVLALAVIIGIYIGVPNTNTLPEAPPGLALNSVVEAKDDVAAQYQIATEGLNALAVKGRAPKTGYSRAQFGDGWEKSGTCDVRNQILARDLKDVTYQTNTCVVTSGLLHDPYTAKDINFSRGKETSSLVQIDHVVALSDAWQKGAQQLTSELRIQLANDGLNLLAVDGPANQNKGDGDAATWLPPNKAFRCAYVARQITVKLKYSLWVTAAEKNAMQNILKSCPTQQLTE